MTMTPKQRDYLMLLAGARYWSGVVDAAKAAGVTMTMRERSGEVSRAKASELIDTLKAGA